MLWWVLVDCNAYTIEINKAILRILTSVVQKTWICYINTVNTGTKDQRPGIQGLKFLLYIYIAVLANESSRMVQYLQRIISNIVLVSGAESSAEHHSRIIKIGCMHKCTF